jgi:hypothetical protein
MTETEAFELLGLDDPDVFAACQALDMFSERIRTGKTTRMLVAAACALLQEKRVQIKGRSEHHSKHLREACLSRALDLAVVLPGKLERRTWILKRVRMTVPKSIMQLPGAGDEIRIFTDHDDKPDLYQDVFDGYLRTFPAIPRPTLRPTSLTKLSSEIYIGNNWRKL